MLFWAIAGALALLVFIIFWRAGRRSMDADLGTRAYDLAVYRDQMAEIERDVARGVLSAEDADQSRAEIGRRVLAADRAQAEAARSSGGMWLTATFAGAATLGALGLYGWLGAPGYPDLPLELRRTLAQDAANARPSFDTLVGEDPEGQGETAPLVAELRRALETRPDDLRGHQLLARNEAALGRPRAALAAQDRVIAILGAEAGADAYMTRAEIRLGATAGFVTPEAEADLRQTLALDPNHQQARFGMGLFYEQIGRPDLAFAMWNPLLAEGPESAPWIAPIRDRIDDTAALAGIQRYVQPAARGPSAADIAAAQDMSPEDQAAMVEGMVASLAQRLATEGGPASDWARLIRAQTVLGNREAALAIYAEALEVFAGAPEAIAIVQAAGREAGLIE